MWTFGLLFKSEKYVDIFYKSINYVLSVNLAKFAEWAIPFRLYMLQLIFIFS